MTKPERVIHVYKARWIITIKYSIDVNFFCVSICNTFLNLFTLALYHSAYQKKVSTPTLLFCLMIEVEIQIIYLSIIIINK